MLPYTLFFQQTNLFCVKRKMRWLDLHRYVPCKVVKKLSGLKVICYTDILLVN